MSAGDSRRRRTAAFRVGQCPLWIISGGDRFTPKTDRETSWLGSCSTSSARKVFLVGFHGVGGGQFSDAAHWVAARTCTKVDYHPNETHLHLSCDQISHHLTSTAIGHVSHIDTGHHLEQFARYMGRTSIAR